MSAKKASPTSGGGTVGTYDSLNYDKVICKVMAIGDGHVGKTCMCHCYANNGEFLADKQEYIPTIFDNYQATLPITDSKGETEEIVLSLWDTAGQDEFTQIRHMCFGARAAKKAVGASGPASPPKPGALDSNSTVNIPTAVFLVCFAVNNPQSFSNVQLKWYHELKTVEREMRQNNGIPSSAKRPFNVILCGTKCDTREDPNANSSAMVSLEEAKNLAKEMKADMYVECSARRNEGIKDVVDQAVTLWYTQRAADIKKAHKKAKDSGGECTML